MGTGSEETLRVACLAKLPSVDSMISVDERHTGLLALKSGALFKLGNFVDGVIDVVDAVKHGRDPRVRVDACDSWMSTALANMFVRQLGGERRQQRQSARLWRGGTEQEVRGLERTCQQRPKPRNLGYDPGARALLLDAGPAKVKQEAGRRFAILQKLRSGIQNPASKEPTTPASKASGGARNKRSTKREATGALADDVFK